MDADFLYYFIYDRFLQRLPCACVCKLFRLKTSSQKLLNGFLPNFIGMFPRNIGRNWVLHVFTIYHTIQTFNNLECGKAVSDLDRILCRVLVKRITG